MSLLNLPYTIILERLALALFIGLFVGLERERRGKETGVRTFSLAAILGAMGSLLGDNYALLSMVMLGLLITFMNIQTLRADLGTELTTSIALLLTGVMGILCGLGQTLVPVAIAVTTVALLAWKQDLSGFSLNLSENELRAAILLAILAFVIYPALPTGSVDPWHVLVPREALVIVILIAGIGFVNYILWKIYGTRGIELTGFLAGLVNSSVTVSELTHRVKESDGQLADVGYRGIILATAAMFLRNAVLLAILAPKAFANALLPLLLMFSVSVVFIFVRHRATDEPTEQQPPLLNVESPFSLPVALRFGLIFLGLQVAGVLANNFLGQLGVYVTSFFGGLFSSASAVAVVASLQTKGTIGFDVAGISALIASGTSALVHLTLGLRSGQRRLTSRLVWAVGTMMVVGTLAVILQALFLQGFLNTII